MKNLLVISTVTIALAVAGFGLSHPTIKTVTQSVKVPVINTVTKTVATPIPIYHIGDTQNGVTLIAEYHSSYQNMRAAVGPTIPVIAFAVTGVSENDLNQFSIIRTTKGFITPTSIMTVPECGHNACVVFEDIPALELYYKDMKWVL